MKPQTEEDPRRLLVSIHGIRSEGEWQEAFKEVFDPHFRFLAFKYGEYKHPVLAVLWIALELWVVILTAIGAVIAHSFHWFSTWQGWVVAVLASFLVFLVAGQFAEGRRNRVVSKLLAEIDEHLGNERHPHVIAHSLGSFIVGRLLQNYQHFDVASVIFMGCVLTPRYGWRDLLDRFDMVRNEVAGRDWVAALAFFLGTFVPEMGPAGIFGFRSSEGVVRTLKAQDYGSHWRPCVKSCVCGLGEAASPNARVLNIRCEKLGHNDIARQRARIVWLPFLWNLPPKIYRDFVLLCQDCADLDSRRQYADLNIKVRELRQQCWFWTRGKLEDYVKVRLQETRGVVCSEAILTFTIRNLYLVIDRAARHDAGSRQQRSLYPEFALRDAMDATP